ncbi:MAG TPA: hypothetical protein VH988_16315 [Thermoanaerobaculia bacterium]|jgi:hypothetical protein|nr:hypothetical protein [Thermoanaerobaculia bacterium]
MRTTGLILGALALCAAPVRAGEVLVPLSAGVAADGTTYTTRVWVTNVGSAARRWTPTFITPGVDGTKAAAGSPLTVNPGATVPVTNLAPAGKGGMLYVNGAPQLVITARLEGTGKDGSLRAAVAGPLVTGRDLAAGGSTVQLHGLSQKQGGLTTDLYLINAARQAAQCTVSAFGADGGTIATAVRYTLPALSLKTVEGALAQFGATSIDEARIAVSCDQAFYAYARVYKAGSGELNVMTPPRSLGRPVTVP